MTFTVSGTSGLTFPDASTQTSGKQVCKAWVNYNGSAGSTTIRNSYNVSSLTLNATGNYYINFSTAMADSNYATIGNCNQNLTSGATVSIIIPVYNTSTTTYAHINQVNVSQSLYAMPMACVAIFSS